MAGFLYFLPGLHGATQADLARVGLAGVFAADAPAVRGCDRGPDGLQGVVVAVPGIEQLAGTPARHGYFPDEQTWRNLGEYWLGWETAAPPRPADLRRPEMLAGYLIKLDDGSHWLCPVARSMPRGSILPRRMSLGPNGEIVWQALPRYAAFCAMAERAWLDYRRANGWLDPNDQIVTLTSDDARDIAVACLAMNYRVGAAEVAALEILTEQNMLAVLDAMIDVPALREVALRAAEQQKKNSPATIPAGSSSDAGPPAA